MDTRRSTGALAAGAAVSVLLGLPGIVPIWLAWYYLSSWPLAELGLTRRDPTENDGVLIPTIIILPIVLVSVLAWYFIVGAVRRRTSAAKDGWFWPVSTVAALLPTLILILISSVR